MNTTATPALPVLTAADVDCIIAGLDRLDRHYDALYNSVMPRQKSFLSSRGEARKLAKRFRAAQVKAIAKVEIAPDAYVARVDYRTASGVTRFMLIDIPAASLAEATRKAREQFDRRTKGRARGATFTVELFNDPVSPCPTTEDDA